MVWGIGLRTPGSGAGVQPILQRNGLTSHGPPPDRPLTRPWCYGVTRWGPAGPAGRRADGDQVTRAKATTRSRGMACPARQAPRSPGLRARPGPAPGGAGARGAGWGEQGGAQSVPPGSGAQEAGARRPWPRAQRRPPGPPGSWPRGAGRRTPRPGPGRCPEAPGRRRPVLQAQRDRPRWSSAPPSAPCPPARGPPPGPPRGASWPPLVDHQPGQAPQLVVPGGDGVGQGIGPGQVQPLLQQPAGAVPVSVFLGQPAHVQERLAQVGAAGLPAQGQGLPVAGPRRREVPLVERQAPRLRKEKGRMACCPVSRRNARPAQRRLAVGKSPPPAGQVPGLGQQRGPGPMVAPAGAGRAGRERAQASSFCPWLKCPRKTQKWARAPRSAALAGQPGPPRTRHQRIAAQVVRAPALRRSATARRRSGCGSRGGEAGRVALPDGVRLAALPPDAGPRTRAPSPASESEGWGGSSAGACPSRGQPSRPRRSALPGGPFPLVPPQQALRHQPFQGPTTAPRPRPTPPYVALGGAEAEAPGEHRETAQQSLLLRGQEVVAPGDGGAGSGAGPGHRSAPRQEGQGPRRGLDPGQQGRGGEEPHPGAASSIARGSPSRRRQSPPPPGPSPGRGAKLGLTARALATNRRTASARLDLAHGRRAGRGQRGRGHRQRRHRELLLARDAQGPRLVTSTVRPGPAASRSSTTPAPPPGARSCPGPAADASSAGPRPGCS